MRSAPGAGGGPRDHHRGDGEFQKPKPKLKPKPKPRPKTSEAPEGPTYRDRAKERREEANPDYAGDQGDPIGTLTGIPGGLPGVANHEELRQLSIEESKFLGGDVEHTHLVKGLDFALLRKVRAELSENVKDEEYHAKHGSGSGSSSRGANIGAPLSVSSRDGLAGQVSADGKVCSFRTPMARSVYDLVVNTSTTLSVPVPRHVAAGVVEVGVGGADIVVKPNERFASGRVSFTFDVLGPEKDDGVSDIPTTTMRSRSDVDAARGSSTANMIMAGRDATVLERLSKIMVYLQLGSGKSGKKAQRRKEARALEKDAAATKPVGLATGSGADGTDLDGGVAEVGLMKQRAESDGARATVPVEEDDDEDIFGDVGRDYEPTVTKKKQNPDEMDKTTSYFDDGHVKGEAFASLPRSTTTKTGIVDADVKAGEYSRLGRAGAVSVDANGLVGPMPEPPAPDFKSIDSFKAHYLAYVAAGTVSSPDANDTKYAKRWDPNAAGSYLQTCPEFALAITAHSVTVLEAEEEAAEEAARAASASANPKGGDSSRVSGGENSQQVLRSRVVKKKNPAPFPLDDAAAVKAELERRAEASLATDDGYAECYAGFEGYGDAVYQSDEDDDDGGVDEKKKRRKDGDEGEGNDAGVGVGGKKGRQAGLGASGKGGKLSVKALEAQRDQKLNSELGSLHKMMKEKYGDKVNVAFGGGGENNEGDKVKTSGKGGVKRGGVGGGDGGGEGDTTAGRRGKRLKM